MKRELQPNSSHKPTSWMNGDKGWDMLLGASGVDVDKFGQYCVEHPKFSKALADLTCYARPVVGGIALGAYAHAVKENNIPLAYASLGLFIVAAISDSFDGYVARKGEVTDADGAKLDQVMDVLFRSELVATVMLTGDAVDRALLLPRAYYEMKLLAHRQDDMGEQGEFKSSTFGKIKVASDGVLGVGLLASAAVRSPKAKHTFSVIRKSAAVLSIGLNAVDVHNRAKRKRISSS